MTPPQLNETELKSLIDDFNDHAAFCRECLTIRNNVGDQVAMELSAGQIALDEMIQRQRAKKRPVRIVALKTRRSQFTSGACAEIFHEVAFFPGRRAAIIADQYFPAAIEAFDYLVQFDLSYKPFRRHGSWVQKPKLITPKKPKTPVPEGSTLEMQWANSSGVDVYSAVPGSVGRGGGRHWVLFDEAHWYRDAKSTLTGAMNMIPDSLETGIIIQSTANGMGGEFYDLCQMAQDPANEQGFEFLFFGWLSHKPYSMPLEGDAAKFQASLNPEERLLVDMHGATLEQLNWRRWKILTSCRGEVDQFHQEFPTTAQEAFLSSGRPVFDHVDLSRHPVFKGVSGELSVIEQGPIKRLVFVPREDERGLVTVWRRPEAGRLYCAGADPSMGVDVDTDKRGKNPDYSVAGIADTHTGELVAMLRGRLRPGAFAEYLAIFLRWYNWAFVCPEVNDRGFFDAFLSTGYPIEQIFSRKRDPSDRRPGRIEELGFETTGLSRSWLVGAAEDAVRGMSIVIHSAVVIRECQTFVIKPNSKREHQDNCHDDCVIMIGLTELARRQAPRRPPPSLQPMARRQYLEMGTKRKLRPDEEE